MLQGNYELLTNCTRKPDFSIAKPRQELGARLLFGHFITFVSSAAEAKTTLPVHNRCLTEAIASEKVGFAFHTLCCRAHQ